MVSVMCLGAYVGNAGSSLTSKSCTKDHIYELNKLECHYYVIITIRKLNFL